jgi:hypothetical protein
MQAQYKDFGGLGVQRGHLLNVGTTDKRPVSIAR